MSESLPFQWFESNGWLVLSGSADNLSDIRAQALSRVNAEGAVAYISLLEDKGDALLEDMADLGAPTGYLVDLDDDDNNAIYERLSTASMIVIEPTPNVEMLKKKMSQTVVQAIKETLQRGSLVLLEGVASNLAGEHIVSESGIVANGLKLVDNVFISSDVASIVEDHDAQKIFLVAPETVFIGIQSGSALVLGPNRHVETWGENQVTISLGSTFDNPNLSSNNS